LVTEVLSRDHADVKGPAGRPAGHRAAAGAAAAAVPGRAVHLGNLGIDGVRLTELAARAQLSLATTSELVDDLQRLGYLERRPDPSDGRAKLIFPTRRGRQALDDAGDRVAQIEQHWAQLLGPDRFADTCRALQELLDKLPANSRPSNPDLPRPPAPS
jgi:DNA-binding MarR family transcriptional regulator